MVEITPSLTSVTGPVFIPNHHGLNTAYISQCVTSCPLHNLFITDLNVTRLRGRAFVQLGNLDNLIQVADDGCVLSRALIEILSKDTVFQEFLQKCNECPNIDARAVEPAEELRALNLTFRSMLTKSIDNFNIPRLFDPPASPFVFTNLSIEHVVQVGLIAHEGDSTAQYVRNRPPEPDMSIQASFAAAQGWLSTCRREHKKCPNQDSMLPTRVIDVGNDIGNKTISLRTNHCEEGPYIALSYCWGLKRFTTLSKANLSSFEASIDLEALPKTIQDAVQVTRSLGIPYLWVDSLCIIQDSPEDKKNELEKMAQIYQNATITLSAASASDSFQGILNRNEDVQSAIDNFHTIEFKLPNKSNPNGLGTVLLSFDIYCGYIARNFAESPISQRAWTLQETLLSPRLLVFDTGPLQWKCLEKSSIYGLDDPHKSNTMTRALADPLLDSDLRHKFLAARYPNGSYVAKDARSVYAWMEIIATYTGRAMTDPEDRLHALSGISAQWKHITGWTYIAGLWVDIFANCLLWRYHFSRSTAGPNKISHPGKYRAPSWSWASINGPVWYGDPSADVYQVQYPHSSQTHVVVERFINPYDYGWFKGPGESEKQLHFCKVDVTAPFREMALVDMIERFEIITDGNSDYPHFLSDHIILDYCSDDHDNTEIIVQDIIMLHSIYHSFNDVLSEGQTMGDFMRREMKYDETGLDETSQEHQVIIQTMRRVYFLELSRARGPEGIILAMVVIDDEWVFKRIGYFRMGRVALSEITDAELDKSKLKGERDWDWEEGLVRKMVRLT